MKSYDKEVTGHMIKPVKYEEFVDMISIIKKYWSINEIADEGKGFL